MVESKMARNPKWYLRLLLCMRSCSRGHRNVPKLDGDTANLDRRECLSRTTIYRSKANLSSQRCARNDEHGKDMECGGHCYLRIRVGVVSNAKTRDSKMLDELGHVHFEAQSCVYRHVVPPSLRELRNHR